MNWFFGENGNTAAGTTFSVTWQKERLEVTMDPQEATLGMLKAYLSKCTDVPMDKMKVMHSGAIMKDDKRKLSDYGVRHGSRLMLIGEKQKQQEVAPLPRYQVLCARIDGIVNSVRELQQALVNFKQLAQHLHPNRQAELQPLWQAMDTAHQQVLTFQHAESAPQISIQTSAAKLRVGQASALYLSPLEKDHMTEKQLVMTYRFIAESLMCLILDLDGIPTEEDPTGVVKLHRKQGVQCIQAIATAVDRVARVLKLNAE